jgi:hypothetical protein
MTRTHIPSPSGVRPEEIVPEPVILGDRHFWKRHDIENMKRKVAGLPPIDAVPTTLEFVSAAQVAHELGVCRVTLKRWLKRARLARETAAVAAE